MHSPSYKLIVDFLNQVNYLAALTVETTTALHEYVGRLPSVVVRLAVLAAHSEREVASIEVVEAWLTHVLKTEKEAASTFSGAHLSLTELSEREQNLLNWIAEQRIPGCGELAQILLLYGLTRSDLEQLASAVDDASALVELLPFIESMLMMQAMTDAISSELVHLSVLVTAAVAEL